MVDTGYTCRVDSVTKAMVVTGPPSGIVSIGGYRFPLRELQDIAGRVDSRSTLAALPDSLVGHRLIGNAPDRDAIQTTLNELGLNPLVAAAFRDRRDRAARRLRLTGRPLLAHEPRKTGSARFRHSK